MKLLLKILLFLMFQLLVFSFSPLVAASEQKVVTIVNPIRGGDFWSYSHSILDTPKNEYQIISQNNLSATWLVRYDALKNPEVIEFLKSLNSNQEVGLFLEVTPSLTNDAGVDYNKSPNWHYSKSVLVIGYLPDDRKKMVDQAVKVFKEKLGRDPKSAGAWWIDAGTLGYLHDKYGLEANLDVSDQFSTDQYQVWGQYWSTPFYPSKINALMPASGKDKKIGVVTIQWAARDPYNGYGNGVFESTYSVQANDYLIHKLDSRYFEKLLDIYPQTTVGLENDFSWRDFGTEYTNQINVLAQRQKQNQLSVKRMEDFSAYYQAVYPDISPPVLITATDPLGGSGRVVWYQTPKYRIGWFYGPYGSVIRDLRELNDGIEEQCLKVACESLKLGFNASQAIDEVNYQTKWVLDEGSISDFKIKNTKEGIEFSYINQSGHKRVVQLFPNDIKVDDDIKPISTAILNVTSGKNNVNTPQVTDKNFRLEFDWTANLIKVGVNFIKFIVFILVFCLIPGLVISRRWFFSIPVGISLFTLMVFLLGYLRLEVWIWLLPLISISLLLKFGLPRIEYNLRFNNYFFILLGTIFFGSISWLITTVKSGLVYSYGLGYWGPNGHDAIWHLSLISELQRNFPPQNPIFAGEALNNYHYFFDLLLARSATLFGIDNQDLLFRFYPLLISILSGLLIYVVTKKLIIDRFKEDKIANLSGILSAFFVYFGGSFGWIVSYFKDRSFGGETTFWAQQGISTLLNPPFAISIVLFLTGLLLFFELEQQKKYLLRIIIPLVIIWGTLIEFKVYGGVLVLGVLGLVALEKAVRKDFLILKVFIPTATVSALVFLPNNLGSASLLEFSPLWLIYSMIFFQDRLNWYRLSLTLQSGSVIKMVAGYSLGILVFLAGNLGTRLIFLGSLKELFKARFLFWLLILGIIFPLLFIQKGNGWNIVQFFYYSLLIAAIFAAITVASFYQKLGSKIGIILIAIIIIFTVPTSWNNLSQYLPDRPPARLPVLEYQALNFLKGQPEGTVLTVSFDKDFRNHFVEPIPLAAYTSTAYVSAFSGHPVFFEDTINLEILGVDYKGRANTERDFFRILDRSKQILKDNNIKYVYVLKKFNLNIDEGRMGMKNIFENDEVKIYKAI